MRTLRRARRRNLHSAYTGNAEKSGVLRARFERKKRVAQLPAPLDMHLLALATLGDLRCLRADLAKRNLLIVGFNDQRQAGVDDVQRRVGGYAS